MELLPIMIWSSSELELADTELHCTPWRRFCFLSSILTEIAAGYDRHGVADHASNLALEYDQVVFVCLLLSVKFLFLSVSAKGYFFCLLKGLSVSWLAQGVLINPRKFDYHTGVFASKVEALFISWILDIIWLFCRFLFEPKDTLEVDAALIATGRAPFTKMVLVWTLENINVATQRGFIPVDERMRVIDGNGKLVPHLYCIGDANGKLMLAHAASAQGISVVEQVTGRDHVLNHLSIPAACFTHPEISMVGLTEPQAREKAEKEGFKVSIAKDKFQGEHKGPTALAENEGEGLAKMIYRPDNGEILGVHIFGLHAADLIHEASNAIALGTRIQPVVDELFKAAKVESPASTTAQSVKAAV
ncbi:unnamed protein product [Brassica oleracea]